MSLVIYFFIDYEILNLISRLLDLHEILDWFFIYMVLEQLLSSTTIMFNCDVQYLLHFLCLNYVIFLIFF